MRFKNSKRMPRTKKVRGWREKYIRQCLDELFEWSRPCERSAS